MTHIWTLSGGWLCQNDQYQHILHLLTSCLQDIAERPRHRWLVCFSFGDTHILKPFVHPSNKKSGSQWGLLDGGDLLEGANMGIYGIVIMA